MDHPGLGINLLPRLSMEDMAGLEMVVAYLVGIVVVTTGSEDVARGVVGNFVRQ